MQTQTFTLTGTWTCPDNITTVQAECWGAGAGGNHPGVSLGGGGGGGGAYTKTNYVPVTPGLIYTVTVGTGGAVGGSGFGSYFFGDADVHFPLSDPRGNYCIAEGGNPGNPGDFGGQGGSGGHIGDGFSRGNTEYAGGDGGTAIDINGGGGGGGAGSTGTGKAGSGSIGGGATNVDGGQGGQDNPFRFPDVNGGGGSGVHIGARGAVILTWDTLKVNVMEIIPIW